MPHLKTIPIGDHYVHLSHSGDCVYYSYSQRNGGLTLRGCYFHNNQIRSCHQPRQVLTDFGIAQLVRDQRRNGSCFVSTIVCCILGQPDDCQELAALRSLRNGYILAHRRGQTWLADYAAHSASLVPWLHHHRDGRTLAAAFFQNVIQPAAAATLAGHYWRAALCYRRGVTRLLSAIGTSPSPAAGTPFRQILKESAFSS